MSKPYLLKPTFDAQRNRWRLNLPGKISPSGRRVKHYFKHHHEALAEANKLRQTFHDFGRSIKMLPANRLVEAIECWDLLDEVFSKEASSGSLRRIVLRECKAIKDREKSITVGALFDSYVEKLKRQNRSENYLKQFRWCKSYLEFWHDTKVSDLTPGNIKFSFSKLPSGNFNSNVRLLRAVLNHGVRSSWLKSNPALSIDFIHRPRVEVTCLSHLVVEKMFRHAQEHEPELIPSFTVGYWTGLRESEIWRLSWRCVNLDDPHPQVFVPAAITKTKEPRTIPLSDNAVAWLEWFFANVRHPQPEERLMERWTLNRLRVARKRANPNWVQNAKRHCFASYWLALHRNLNELVLLLGHTTPSMARRHYLGAATYTDAQKYFERYRAGPVFRSKLTCG